MAFHHGVRVTTSLSIHQIEDWCDANCRGDFDVALGGMSDDLRKKTLDVYFEHRVDLDAFKAAYRTMAKAS